MRAALAGDVVVAAALVRADLTAGRRALGTGRAAVLTSSAASALLAGALVLGVAGASTYVHGLATGGSPDAAAGAVDLLFVAAPVAGLVSPMAGGPTARIMALARATAAPIDARVVLLAAGARELLAAPVGPALLLGGGVACGLGAAQGPVVAALAVFLAIALTVFALTAGVALALVTAQGRGAAIWRIAAIAVAVVVLGSVSGGVPVADGVGLSGALEAIHLGRHGAFVVPSWWSAAPLRAGGALAWWPLVILPAAVAWTVWSAPRVLSAAWPSARVPERRFRVRAQMRLPGRFGALLAKDVALLLRDTGLHVAIVRHAVLALAPLAAVATAAWFARTDVHVAARLARALPGLALVAHLVVVAQSGLATFMVGTDGGGVTHVLSLPVRAVALVGSKALAWALVFAPATGLATAIVVLAAGSMSGADGVAGLTLLAGLEGLAAGCAGTGAGIVAASLWPGRPTTVHGGPPPARTGPAGLAAGLGAAGLAIASTAGVAYAFHAIGGASGAAVGLALGLAALGLGVGLGASLIEARPESFSRALAQAPQRV